MTTERECDQLLVDRAKTGCRKSFDMLVVKYQRRLMRLISQLVYDRIQAEDLVQESFIKAYRGLADFRGECAFYTWLYTIGVNTAKQYLITQAKRNRTFIQTHVEQGPTFADAENIADMHTPESALENKQLALAIYSALNSLTLDERTSIVLRELEGLSYEEISKIMQCPVGTVRSRIFRARQEIVKQITPLLDSSRPSRF
ncbi:sigma-70 family RNA polymerase sigma factor [Massilia sp. CCM 9210]|uniref:sigma-70 family RNA polymerase sigma factor n=1 Tax=Massilia scottii TaxID=3057166 RepID=UPI0027966D9C|nr:sigma-70 family RNA polymerase sigma factor [Massilia sp. CCM 9210]MDQ1817531.1 sigma-70 family RNA polymerase sigma factor [Massilia sp. CCM 9210]